MIPSDQATGSAGVRYQTSGSVTVITLPERVEAACVLALRNRSERAFVSGSRAIAVDLRAMLHIDTHALSELSIALRRIGRHNPTLAVVGADPRVRWVLELCDIEGLQLHPTMSGALAHVRADQRLQTRPPRRLSVRRARPLRRSSSSS